MKIELGIFALLLWFSNFLVGILYWEIRAYGGCLDSKRR